MAKAIEWLKKAEKQGHADAKELLGIINGTTAGHALRIEDFFLKSFRIRGEQIPAPAVFSALSGVGIKPKELRP